MKLKLTALLGLALFLLAPPPGLAAAANRTAPKPLETPSPVYPEALNDTGKPGRAVIEILADGLPVSALRAMEDGLDEFERHLRKQPAPLDGAGSRNSLRR